MSSLVITLKVKKDGFKNIEDLFRKIEEIPKKFDQVNKQIVENSGVMQVAEAITHIEDKANAVVNNVAEKIQNTKERLFSGRRTPLFAGQSNKLLDQIKVIRETATNSAEGFRKSVDNIFKNIFVGTDNIFPILATFRKVGLKIGTFFGNSKATITVMINDIVKFLQKCF